MKKNICLYDTCSATVSYTHLDVYKRQANMLRLLGSEEITSLIEERGNIEVHCDFCNKLYAFDQIDAAQLMIAEAVIATSKKIH